MLDTVFADLSAPDIAGRIAERMRAQASPPRDTGAPERLRRRMAALDAKIEKLVGLIAEDAEAAPAYRRAVAKMEGERAAVEQDLREAERCAETACVVALWTAADVQRLLGTLRESLQSDLEAGRLRDLRSALSDLIERVEYDPEARSATIHYALQTGVKMASPRAPDAAPVRWRSIADVPLRMAAR